MKRLLLISGWLLFQTFCDAAAPVAKQVPVVKEIHGERRVDDYDWMREKTNPEVMRHLEAENAYTAAVMKPTEALQKKLYAEMLGRIQQTDSSVPYRYGDWWYYTRWEEGKQYPIYCRKAEGKKAAEVVILDVNELAKPFSFFSVRTTAVSDDGNVLAYLADSTGYRQYKLTFKDLKTGAILPESAERAVMFAWATDSKHYFYTVEDPVAKRPHQLYRGLLGSSEAPVLLYEEKDERFRIDLVRTRSKGFLLLTALSKDENETRFLAAGDPKGEWKVVVPRRDKLIYIVDHRGSDFYLQTNDRGDNYRLVKAPVANPAPENWAEVVPFRENVVLQSFSMFADFVMLTEREGGLLQFSALDLKSGKSKRVGFSEPTYHIKEEENPEFATRKYRYSYESLITPKTVFDYDVDRATSQSLKQDVVKGYSPKRYRSEWIFATASDGTRVPISIAYKRGLVKNGKAPALLYGYGSYGSPTRATFSVPRVSLLDRGFVFAIAHIRGGGDLGRPWYNAGKKLNKKNTFTDFIAVAEHLVAQKYTSSKRLGIYGLSAGGLLMGAVTNMRPELFRVVLSDVPFVDVINTMLDPSIPFTTNEYKEWGDPNDQPYYAYMKSYCPYTNIEKKAYPAILVRTAFNDSQVMYFEPAKYVAKLRAHKTDSNPLLFKVNLAAGHGGPSGRLDLLKEDAFQYAFLITYLR